MVRKPGQSNVYELVTSSVYGQKEHSMIGNQSLKIKCWKGCMEKWAFHSERFQEKVCDTQLKF